MGVGDPIIPVPRRWSASPLFGLVVTSFLFAKEAQKGMSSPSLEGTKPLAEGMEVPVGSELGPPEGPSVFGFCDGLRGKSGVGSLYHTRLVAPTPGWCVRIWKIVTNALGKGKLSVGGMAHRGQGALRLTRGLPSGLCSWRLRSGNDTEIHSPSIISRVPSAGPELLNLDYLI